MGFAAALRNEEPGDGRNGESDRRDERQSDNGDGGKTQNSDENDGVSSRAEEMPCALFVRPLQAIIPRFRHYKLSSQPTPRNRQRINILKI